MRIIMSQLLSSLIIQVFSIFTIVSSSFPFFLEDSLAVQLLLALRNQVLKFKLHLSVVSQNPSMQAISNIINDAKQSLQRLQGYPLNTQLKRSIHRLQQILNNNDLLTKLSKIQKLDTINLQSISKQARKIDLGDRIQTNDNLSQGSNDCDQIFTSQKQRNQPKLFQIIQKCDYILVNDENTKDSFEDLCFVLTTSSKNGNLTNDLPQIFSILIELPNCVDTYINEEGEREGVQQNNSNCSFNTQSNCNSNSNSVRSLLTEKLRSLQLQDFQDPETQNSKIIVHGNLLRQLNKQEKCYKPFILNKKFQDVSQPYSMQNKHYKQRQLHQWPKPNGRKEQRQRVESKRTILGEINLGQSELRQKRAKKDDLGCARCEIY